jgi:AraC-like DNA-binding protein
VTLDDYAAALGDASRELADLIAKQSQTPPGVKHITWSRELVREVEAARARRDAIATEYRAAVTAWKRALADREPGYWAERRRNGL